jgi:hypothetical protein
VFDSQQGARCFSSPQRPMQWVSRTILQGLKRLRREAGHVSSTSVDFTNVGAIPALPRLFHIIVLN